MTLEYKQNKREYILFSVLWIILSYLISLFWKVPVLPLSLFIGLIWISIFINTKYFQYEKSKLLFILIMIVKFLLLLYQSKYKNLPMGGNDWQGYHGHATNLLNSVDCFIELFFVGETNLFSRGMAIIYYLFGTHLPLINCIVFIISILQIKYIYKISKLVINKKQYIDRIIILTIIWPINFIFSITILREAPIQFLFTISIYYMIMYIKFGKMRYILLSVVYSIISAALHSGMIAITLTYILVFIGYDRETSKIKFNLFSITILLVIISILFTSGLLSPIMQKFESIENMEDLISKSGYVAGNTAYVSIVPSNPIDLLLQTPYRVIMFALSPFPWQVYSVGTLIAFFIEGIPQYLIMYCLYKYIFRFKDNTEEEKSIKKLIIYTIILSYIMFAWGTANFGTAMRHRSKFSSIMIIILGKVFYDKNKVYNIMQKNV